MSKNSWLGMPIKLMMAYRILWALLVPLLLLNQSASVAHWHPGTEGDPHSPQAHIHLSWLPWVGETPDHDTDEAEHQHDDCLIVKATDAQVPSKANLVIDDIATHAWPSASMLLHQSISNPHSERYHSPPTCPLYQRHCALLI